MHKAVCPNCESDEDLAEYIKIPAKVSGRFSLEPVPQQNKVEYEIIWEADTEALEQMDAEHVEYNCAACGYSFQEPKIVEEKGNGETTR